MIRGAVLGSPISHSLSPTLHMGAFNFLGIDGRYEAFDVPSGGLSLFFAEQSENFDYLSLTMPLKEEAFALDIEFDSLSSRIGSANTLYRRDGVWRGCSTDGSGFIAAVQGQGPSVFSQSLILGAGGTARAIADALDGWVPSISVLGRTSTRRDALSRCVMNSKFDFLAWRDDFDLSRFDFVVNTTPVRAADLLAESLSPVIDALLFDVIYKPWPTVLASRWADQSGRVINGKELLLWQGLDQLDLVLDVSLDRSNLAPHLRELLARQ